jgi:hypothetical protein
MALTLRLCTGFEFGTTSGWTIGNAGNKIVDSVGGSPAVDAAAAITGSYGLLIDTSAAAENVTWTTDTLGAGQNRAVAVLKIRWDTLPGANAEVCRFSVTGQPDGEIWYNSATGKLAATMEGGSFVDGPTVAADTVYQLELSYDCSGATYTLNWWVDGAAQTQASIAGTASTILNFRIGSIVAETQTLHVDDVAVWTDTAAIGGTPFGAHKVIYLGPDTGGSLDVATITAAEWNTFAGATPTLSAWNAATALAAIDERPVGLGASADGFCRITGTDADYVGVPMTSYTLAGGESVVGLRMLACCWAATTTTCFHSFASWNGTTATTLFASADVGTDNSATAPAWVCKMCTLADFDTQGELDALQFRFGSTDTTPDAGIHFICGELLVKEAVGAPPAYIPAIESQYGGYY